MDYSKKIGCILILFSLFLGTILSAQCIPEPLVWLKADAGFSAGTWLDQTTNSKDAINYGNPVLISKSLNNNPGISYDSDDHSEIFLPEVKFASGNHHVSIFAVYKPNTSSNTIGIMGNQAGGLNNIMIHQNIIGDGSGFVPDYPVPQLFGAFPHLISYQIDEEDNVAGVPNASTVYQNGTSILTYSFDGDGLSNVNDNFYIGKSGSHGTSAYLDGIFYEFIIFENSSGTISISDKARQILESYLAIKYGIALSTVYCDSQGSLIKDIDDDFGGGVACIGKDDFFELEQTKSLQINKFSNITFSSNELMNREFISLGHNARDERLIQIFEKDQSNYFASERTWKLENKYLEKELKLSLTSENQIDHLIFSIQPDFSEFEIIKLEEIEKTLNTTLKIKAELYFKLATKFPEDFTFN